MSRILHLLFGFLLLTTATTAQTSDDQYRLPLQTVLDQIQQRYGVKIRPDAAMVKDKWVTYAEWRYRPDVDETLKNVLAPFDLQVSKTGDKAYKLKPFQYHLKTPEEGAAQLAYLATRYHDAATWEKRKAELRSCMWEALRLSPMPPKPTSKPIITNKRQYDGYTVENVALETMPGVYVTGSLYKPLKAKGKVPVIISPDGHFGDGRYRADAQYRCATLARMGAMVYSYDLFAWGESLLQFKSEDHRRSLAMTVQALNGLRSLDYLLSLKDADKTRVAITGGSGGGSQTMLLTALDDRIKVSVPVVMLSTYHNGGCPCESGMPVHLCGNGTNNAELAAMAAPRPQLAITDGGDWTAHTPEVAYPYLQKIYGYYGKSSLVENVHLPKEGHDYGASKRQAMYEFLAKNLTLNLSAAEDKTGKLDESKVTIEKEETQKVFGKNGELLPSNALKGFEALQAAFNKSTPATEEAKNQN
ncbi:alpha/beta hydrolase family protein [Hymenobacter volaticus]|uniref:Acetylxylan esterase n=1 Tax=Hymenobacter volaticus TaxID=2932254 RepID=A0ABY4GAP8_9BACT|nr:acetylxylan esterase [Hymenobacter volaticus]UOQ67979.1 acetylxylan esterase [Hymenobacter volaticus]